MENKPYIRNFGVMKMVAEAYTWERDVLFPDMTETTADAQSTQTPSDDTSGPSPAVAGSTGRTQHQTQHVTERSSTAHGAASEPPRSTDIQPSASKETPHPPRIVFV